MSEPLRIAVCLKQILDPEIPLGAFALDDHERAPIVVGHPASLVMDSYAANALEAALRLREAAPSSRVTAICVGDAASDDVLRRAFALTADAAVRVWDDAWAELDGLAVAHALARAIEHVGPVDLVLCGREAGDIEEAVVGPALAEELGATCVTLGRSIELCEGAIRVERAADGLVATVEAPLPAVVTVASSAQNVPRMPKARDSMLARMKTIEVCGAPDLDLDASRIAPRARLERLILADAGGHCELVPGEDGPARAAELAQRLAQRVLL